MVEVNPILPIRQYLEDSEITPALMEALEKMALEKPENPLLYIGQYLLKGGHGSGDAEAEADSPAEIPFVEPERPASVPVEKPPSPVAAAAPVEQAADKPKKKLGDMECAPISMKFTDLSRMGFEPHQSYTLHWKWDNDAARCGETWDGELNKQNAYQWKDFCSLPVMDKATDKIVTVILTKSGTKFANEVICRGNIPAGNIAKLYDEPNLRQKSLLLDMFNTENERCASFRAKVTFKTE